MSDMKGKEITEITLENDWEFRFEIESKNETVYLKLKSGTAEIFGSELVLGKQYKFTTGAKIGVFTWQRCVLEFIGKHSSYYIAKESPMMYYLHCHCSLEKLRNNAEQNNTRGPVVMVVGPSDSGKSVLCKLLLNYATRIISNSRKPVYVELDVNGGHVSVPGTIGAMVVEHPASIEDGFVSNTPLVYNYGHLDINENPALYNLLISKTADKIFQRIRNNKAVYNSGIIINTFGSSKSKGYQHLTHVAQAFEVDVILVLDQERIYNELVRDMPPFVKIAMLPKSAAAVEKSRNVKNEHRDAMIRQYFYGTTVFSLSTYTIEVKFSDVKIVKVGVATSSDSKGSDHCTKVTTVEPGSSLLHHLLAITHCKDIDDNFIETNVAGFVCVMNIDIDKEVLTFLSPQKKLSPEVYLIYSNAQYNESR